MRHTNLSDLLLNLPLLVTLLVEKRSGLKSLMTMIVKKTLIHETIVAPIVDPLVTTTLQDMVLHHQTPIQILSCIRHPAPSLSHICKITFIQDCILDIIPSTMWEPFPKLILKIRDIHHHINQDTTRVEKCRPRVELVIMDMHRQRSAEVKPGVVPNSISTTL